MARVLVSHAILQGRSIKLREMVIALSAQPGTVITRNMGRLVDGRFVTSMTWMRQGSRVSTDIIAGGDSLSSTDEATCIPPRRVSFTLGLSPQPGGNG
jgi:hypothetical protein